MIISNFPVKTFFQMHRRKIFEKPLPEELVHLNLFSDEEKVANHHHLLLTETKKENSSSKTNSRNYKQI